MIKSALQSENIEQFLRERYFLESELMKKSDSKNRNEKGTPNKRILNELFIEKVLQDPYFSIYVCKMIEESDFDLTDVLAYVQYIILEKYLNISTLFDALSGDKTSCNSTQMESGDIIIDDLIDTFSGKHEMNALKDNDYYTSLWRNGEKTILEAMETTSGRNDKINVRWEDESPFCWSGGYGLHLERLTQYTKHHRDNEWGRRNFEQEKASVLKHLSPSDLRNQTRFLCENIESYLIYYNSGKRYLKTPFFAFLNFKPDFICEIKIALEKHGMPENKNDTYIAKYLKLYMDAILISQISWFNSLEECQKIETLNRYYDDTDLSISNTNLNLFGKHGLLHNLAYNEAKKLYKEKDYDNAVSISNQILENTDDEFLKYLCVSLIADIYQVKEDYKSAVVFFEKAYEISKNFMHDMVITGSLDKLRTKNPPMSDAVNRHYRMNRFHLIQYVELLNMAEMYCYLGNKDKANECFRKLNEEIQCFSIPKKIYILYKLAVWYGQHQELLKYRLYQNVVKLADSYEAYMVGRIEDDMGKEIFQLLGHDDYSTKEICARKWIDNEKSFAIKSRDEIKTIPHEDDRGADLIKVHKDYESRFHHHYSVNKIDDILRTSDLFSEINDVHSIVPITIEPRKMINQIKYAIKNLEKIEGKDDLKINDLGYQDVIQRLNLACSRCYYSLREFDVAENILKEIIANSSDKNVLFNAHCVLGLSLIKNWDIRSGINEFEKAVDMNDLNGALFEYCMYELLQLDNKEIFFKVLDSVVDKINSNPINQEDYSENGYCLATWQFNEFGLTEEAMHFIKNGLSVENNELVRISLLEEKAYISFLDGDYITAENILIEIFHISLSNQNTSAEYHLLCSSAWHKLSIIYAKKHEFKKAVDCIDCAITSLDKCRNIDGSAKYKMEPYNTLKEIYTIFSKHIIKSDKINIKEVIDIFETADEIIYNGLEQNYNRSFDFKLALGEYGKGLETYMHDNISAYLRIYVFERNDEPVPSEFWRGDLENNIKNLYIGFTNALHFKENMTIPLGQWKRLIRDVFDDTAELTNNPYLEDSCEFIKNFASENQWDIISEACAIVSEYRNGATHYGKGTLEDVLKVREDIIEQINKVIDVMGQISIPTI